MMAASPRGRQSPVGRPWRRSLPRRRPVGSSATVAVFPSMKAGKFLSVLAREPLGYKITRQKGSHRTLEADGRPKLLWSYHDSADVPPGVIRKYLVNVIGLSESEALALLRG
jgi:predicted RNA binding protein YcfA (HicA-like mRNA interferase family)